MYPAWLLSTEPSTPQKPAAPSWRVSLSEPPLEEVPELDEVELELLELEDEELDDVELDDEELEELELEDESPPEQLGDSKLPLCVP